MRVLHSRASRITKAQIIKALITKVLGLLVLVASCAFIAAPALAIDAIEFEDPKDLARYQQLTYELRCPKCQNQNLIDSDSQISEDLRREVARLINEGKNDDQIKIYMVERYGDFILYKPPVQSNTLLLWAGPVIMLILGLLIFGIIIFKRSRLVDDEDGELERPDESA